MIKKPEEQEPAFKVVDRRRFEEDGTEKSCCDHDHGHAHSHNHSDDDVQKQDLKKAATPMPMNFSLFVQTLAHQAMMGLGMVPWPDSGLVKKDLTMAQETIDLLHMLKDKTKGNLDQDEQAMMDSILYQLQLVFVELSK